MPRISVVVPIYDVERHLDACLRSVAAQTYGDLEVVMVDDGSPDGSAAIAAGYEERDRRFRLVSRPNGGLSRARNTGIDHASGEFLVFLDSDDVLPPRAYERLIGALDETGSDFATGNVLRLSSLGTAQAPFLAKAFARTRLRTHVTRFRPLLADRCAWNKLWRRSFWEEHEFRFPDGRIHEDIPVTVPAHFEARAVDVLAEPVYLYRIREGGDLSITQRRHELRALRDRMAALDDVRAHLERRGPAGAVGWYQERSVGDDLRLHLNLLDEVDDEYRTEFVDRANAFLEDAPPGVCDALPAIDRLKWHLVRRRLVPELREVLRFQRDDLAHTPAVRIRGRWYGEYPFREDARLDVPRSVYRLGRGDPGLSLSAHLEGLRFERGKLRLQGHASITGVGAARAGGQRLELAALRPGRWRRARRRVPPVRLRTYATYRPDLPREEAWAGFEAALEPADLPAGDGRWELYVAARAGGLRRRRARFALAGPELVRAIDVPGDGDRLVRAAATAAGGIVVEARTRWAAVRDSRLPEPGVLELDVDVRVGGDAPGLVLVSGGEERAYPLVRSLARIPLADLAAGAWELAVDGAGRRLAVALPGHLSGAAWRSGDLELTLVRTDQGDAELFAGAQVPVPVETAGNTPSKTGVLESSPAS